MPPSPTTSSAAIAARRSQPLLAPPRAGEARPLAADEVDVLGIGESSLDHVCLVEGHPAPGSKIDLNGSVLEPGGQVATAMLACQKLGLKAAYIGAVGDDPAAHTVLSPLRKAGVDVSGVRCIAGARTRTAVILVERATGERTVLGYRDPSLELAPGELRREDVVRARILHLDARDPDLSAWAAGVARAAGIPVVLDADALWGGAEKLLRNVDFPIVSRAFAEEFGESGTVRDGLAALVGTGSRLAVVTLGEQGALAADGHGHFESQAYRVRARDTTGAGDAFHAGFIWGLLQGRSAEGCLRTAHAVAAMNCGAVGAQGGLPTRPELERFLADHAPADAARTAGTHTR